MFRVPDVTENPLPLTVWATLPKVMVSVEPMVVVPPVSFIEAVPVVIVVPPPKVSVDVLPRLMASEFEVLLAKLVLTFMFRV